MTLAIPWIGPDDRELRYCLRSLNYLSKYLTLICAKPPQWLRNFTHISYKDNRQPQWNHRNVWEKLLLVPDDEFIWSADDIFTTHQWQPCNHATGLLSDQIYRKNPGNPYHNTLINTHNVLGDVLAFNSHTPVLIERKRLHSIDVDWCVPHGYCIKTLYCQGLPHVMYNDVKLIYKQQPGIGWFSSSPTWMSAGGEAILRRLFPRPSVWEK